MTRSFAQIFFLSLFFFFINLTFNSTSWIVVSPVGCAQVCPCFSWVVLPRTKISDVLFLSHIGWLHHHSASTLNPKSYLPFGLVTDWKSSVSRKRESPQFILQYGSATLGSFSGASWERNAWSLSLVLRIPRDNSHIIYVTFTSASYIPLRQCILKIRSISLKGTGRERILKGTMFPLCAFSFFMGPLIIYWVKEEIMQTQSWLSL